MNKNVVRLYPETGESVSLEGLYLRRERLAGRSESSPFVYANFLTSIDGRIALRAEGEEYYQLPNALKSDEDFRLFLELYAHADCIITHAGYMRSLSSERLGNILQLPDLGWSKYIHDWRAEHGLSKNPDVVIISSSLDFPWHESLNHSQQKVHIATGGCASEKYKQQWLDAGHKVHQCGDEQRVSVNVLMEYLNHQGYQSVYLVAGPELLEDLISCNYVNRFFITMSHQLLGGQDFKTLLGGSQVDNLGRLKLESMFMDLENSNGLGQWFSEFSFDNH